MKNKFESLKKLNVGTVMSNAQQKNVLGGYGGELFIECFYGQHIRIGFLYVSQYYDGYPLYTCRERWPQTSSARISAV